jgi:hypothetical protein
LEWIRDFFSDFWNFFNTSNPFPSAILPPFNEGARNGIRKCFRDLGGLNESDIIRMVADRQQIEFERLGIEFKSLWERPLQLIDCQNLFCEVNKYARHAHPQIIGITGRTRIKQTFRSSPHPIKPFSSRAMRVELP